MPVLFLSKLAVILVTMLQFLFLFNIGIYASAVIPCLLVPGVPWPKATFLSLPLLRENGLYFVDCLPIVAVQYLMALRSRNALVPIGFGFLCWVGALAAISSRFAVWWPYDYTIINYLRDKPKGAIFATHPEFHSFAVASFALITIASYILFVTNEQKAETHSYFPGGED